MKFHIIWKIGLQPVPSLQYHNMASWSGRGKGQKKDHNEIITEDEVFTAVVIADSYDSSLHPHTLSHPRVRVYCCQIRLIDQHRKMMQCCVVLARMILYDR